jgi:hypothetical protein
MRKEGRRRQPASASGGTSFVKERSAGAKPNRAGENESASAKVRRRGEFAAGLPKTTADRRILLRPGGKLAAATPQKLRQRICSCAGELCDIPANSTTDRREFAAPPNLATHRRFLRRSGENYAVPPNSIPPQRMRRRAGEFQTAPANSVTSRLPRFRAGEFERVAANLTSRRRIRRRAAEK